MKCAIYERFHFVHPNSYQMTGHQGKHPFARSTFHISLLLVCENADIKTLVQIQLHCYLYTCRQGNWSIHISWYLCTSPIICTPFYLQNEVSFSANSAGHIFAQSTFYTVLFLVCENADHYNLGLSYLVTYLQHADSEICWPSFSYTMYLHCQPLNFLNCNDTLFFLFFVFSLFILFDVVQTFVCLVNSSHYIVPSL